MRIAFFGLVAMVVASLTGTAGMASLGYSRGRQPRLHSFDIKATYPHNPNSFTQGLEFEHLCMAGNTNCSDVLWESTGMNGESEVRLTDLKTGALIKKKRLAQQDFGEGLVRTGDRILQLTWRKSKVLSYSIANLDDVKELRSPLQDGWGITHTGGKDSDLVISDGTATLTVVEHETLDKMSSMQVMDGGKPVRFLNELEYIKGEVWANVWQTECIARINHKTGTVRGWIMLHGLLDKLRKANVSQAKPMDVLNGIAWDKEGKRLFVTGKYWPSVFEVKLRPHPGRNRPETLAMAREKCII